MRKNQIKKESKIDKLLEIPKEISTNEPRLTNMGFNKMLIENYKMILEYQDFFIRISTQIGIININGFDLKLGEMTADEVLVTGKIESIDLSKNPILRREFKDDKLGVLDILAELDGKEKCNIEMQLIDQSNIIERILYYWSRLYTRQIKIGEDYSLLEKTIVILITDFEVKNLKEMDYHSVWKIMDNKTGGKILTDKLEIDIIELPKIKGREKEKDKLLDWLYFLENPKSERVTEKMGENKEIKEATEKLDSLSEDERMQRIADLRLKAIMDEKAIYAKGLEKGKLEVAKKMLELKISKETIAKATGLTMQEIENIPN